MWGSKRTFHFYRFRLHGRLSFSHSHSFEPLSLKFMRKEKYNIHEWDRLFLIIISLNFLVWNLWERKDTINNTIKRIFRPHIEDQEHDTKTDLSNSTRAEILLLSTTNCLIKSLIMAGEVKDRCWFGSVLCNIHESGCPNDRHTYISSSFSYWLSFLLYTSHITMRPRSACKESSYDRIALINSKSLESFVPARLEENKCQVIARKAVTKRIAIAKTMTPCLPIKLNSQAVSENWRWDEMEGHKNKITVLMAEINRVNEENQKLKSMLNCACYRYNYLQEHIRRTLQQANGVDGSQLFNRDHPSEVKLRRRSINVDSTSTVSHQSAPYRGDREQSRETVEKNVKFMEDQLLPSKKRKNGMIDSSIEQTEKSPKKKFQLMTKASGQHNVAAAKRILSVQARSEASLINDGCQWRKYGEKMIKNNEQPRSYYRCVTAPGCPAKKQVQTCAQDHAIVATTYKGYHTHSLSALPTAAMHVSSNQLSSHEPATERTTRQPAYPFFNRHQHIIDLKSVNHSRPHR